MWIESDSNDRPPLFPVNSYPSEPFIELPRAVDDSDNRDGIIIDLVKDQVMGETSHAPEANPLQTPRKTSCQGSYARLGRYLVDGCFHRINKAQTQLRILDSSEPGGSLPDILNRERGAKNPHAPKRFRMDARMSSKSALCHSPTGESSPSLRTLTKSDGPTRRPSNRKASSSTSVGEVNSPSSIHRRMANACFSVSSTCMIA